MSLANIIDNRTNKYLWLKVDAIIEPTWHDNPCGGDRAPRDREETVNEAIDYRYGVSVLEAISWARKQRQMTTLYLYDDGTHPATSDGKNRKTLDL